MVLTGRVFRQTDITSEIIKVLTMMALGILGGLGGLLTDWSWTLTARLEIGGLFAVFIGIMHRFDFGDEKSIIRRELHAGIEALPLVMAKTLQSTLFTFLQAFGYSLVTYVLQPRMQSFGTFFLAYFFFAMYWTALAQWLSLGCISQINAVIGMIMIPSLSATLSGTLICTPEVEALQAFCPRKIGVKTWLPDLPSFQLLWAAEIRKFPPYVANFSVVNSTNYWYSMNSDQVDQERFQFGLNNTVSYFAFTKEGAQIGSSLFALIIDSILLRLIVWGFVKLLITTCRECCCASCIAWFANTFDKMGIRPYSMPQAEERRMEVQSAKQADSIRHSTSQPRDGVILSDGPPRQLLPA